MNFIKSKIRDFRLFIKNKRENPLLYKYPLVVSYPRSGAHWISSVSEMYFNRPRLRKGSPSFLPDKKKRRDWMWIHDHDADLKIIRNLHKKKPLANKILFLYRNPVDVIYSHLNAISKNYNTYGYLFGKKFKNRDYAFSEEAVMDELSRWITYHREYFKEREGIQITYISYEAFKNPKTRNSEFKKICDFFEKPFSKERFEKIFEKYGNLDLDEHKKTNKELYSAEKKRFIKEWGKIILEATKEIRKKFK